MIQLPNDFAYFPALEGLLHEQQPWWRLVQQHFLQAAFFKSSFRVFSYSKIMANLFSYSTHVFFTYCLCFETFSASTLYCEAMHTKHHEVSVDIRLDCWISLAALLSWLISHWDIFYWHRASVLFKKTLQIRKYDFMVSSGFQIEDLYSAYFNVFNEVVMNIVASWLLCQIMQLLTCLLPTTWFYNLPQTSP